MNRIFVSYGAMGVIEPAVRLGFPGHQMNDAVVRFSEKVVELDKNPDVSCGWARLETTDGAGVLACWTKTSNETPTTEGEDCPV